jgi:hypothetical protein
MAGWWLHPATTAGCWHRKLRSRKMSVDEKKKGAPAAHTRRGSVGQPPVRARAQPNLVRNPPAWASSGLLGDLEIVNCSQSSVRP